MTREIYPPRREDTPYLTEGGTETEIMYLHGHELPKFAMFPLLDDPEARATLKDMWRRALRVAAETGCDAIVTGLDYRASPDWGAVLGYTPEGLADMQRRCVDFQREVAREFEADIGRIVISGTVGPRGDAYALNREITETDAEEYHAVQMATLREAGADMASAMTFNNVPEAIGVTRAARDAGLPLSMGLTLDGSSRLKSGPTLREAVEAIDAATGEGPDYYALNCSHPLEYEPALEPGDWIGRLRGLRPNAAKMDKIALCKLGHLEDGDPVELGDQLADAAARYPWMDVFGGCCGTDERHLREIAARVRAVRGRAGAEPARAGAQRT